MARSSHFRVPLACAPIFVDDYRNTHMWYPAWWPSGHHFSPGYSQLASIQPTDSNLFGDSSTSARLVRGRLKHHNKDTTEGTVDAGALKFCSRCGYRITHDESRFCSLCGEALQHHHTPVSRAPLQDVLSEYRAILPPSDALNSARDPAGLHNKAAPEIRVSSSHRNSVTCMLDKRASDSARPARSGSVDARDGNEPCPPKDSLTSHVAAPLQRIRPRKRAFASKSAWRYPAAAHHTDHDDEQQLHERSHTLERELQSATVGSCSWLLPKAVRVWGLETSAGAASMARTGQSLTLSPLKGKEATGSEPPSVAICVTFREILSSKSFGRTADAAGAQDEDHHAGDGDKGSCKPRLMVEHAYGFSSPGQAHGKPSSQVLNNKHSRGRIGRRTMALSADGAGVVYAVGGLVTTVSGGRVQHGMFALHRGAVSCVAVAVGGRLAASGEARDGSKVWVWEVESCKPAGSVDTTHGVSSVAFAAGDELLVGLQCDEACTVSVWRWRDGGQPLISGSSEAAHMLDVACVPAESGGVCTVDAVAGFATVGVKRVTFWDVVSSDASADAGYWLEAVDGDVVLGGERKGPSQVAVCAAFSSLSGGGEGGCKGWLCLTGMKDGSVMVWGSGRLLHIIKGLHQGGVTCMAVVGSRLVTGGADGAVRTWDAARIGGKDTASMQAAVHSRDLEQAAGLQCPGSFGDAVVGLSVREGDGEGDLTVAVGIEESSLLCFRLNKGVASDVHAVAVGAAGGAVAAAAVHPQDEVLVTVGLAGMMAVWNTDTRRLTQRLELVGGDGWRRGGRCVEFRPPEADEAVVGLETGEVVVIAGAVPGLRSIRRVRALAEGNQGAAVALSFSEDGRNLAVGLEGGAVVVLRAGEGYRRGSECWGLKGEAVRVRCVTTGSELTVEAWDRLGWHARWRVPNNSQTTPEKAAEVRHGVLLSLRSTDDQDRQERGEEQDEREGVAPMAVESGRSVIRGDGLWWGLTAEERAASGWMAMVGDAEGSVRIIQPDVMPAQPAGDATAESERRQEECGMVVARVGGHGGGVTAACVCERSRKAFTISGHDGAVVQWSLRREQRALDGCA